MSTATDLGLLALRVGFGAAVFGHGTQKLFGWFGGGGLAGTEAFFDSAGFVPGRRNALLAGLAEAGGGTAIVFGLGTGAAGAAVTGNMIVAGSTHARNGFFGQNGGFELPAAYAAVGTVLALTGGGRYSLDALTGGVLDRPWLRTVGYIGAIAAAAAVIAGRRQELARRPPSASAADEAAGEAEAQP